MPATKAIVRFHRKDDVTIRVTITNPDGTAYDLTGASLKMLIKEAKADTDAAAKITKLISETPSATDGAIVLPATLGLADFFILDAETGALSLEVAQPPVRYPLGVKLKTAGALFNTLVDGEMGLRQELIADTF